MQQKFKLTTFDKALIAFAIGLVTFVVNLYQSHNGWDGSDTTALIGWLTTTGLVYFKANKESSDPTTSTPNLGPNDIAD